MYYSGLSSLPWLRMVIFDRAATWTCCALTGRSVFGETSVYCQRPSVSWYLYIVFAETEAKGRASSSERKILAVFIIGRPLVKHLSSLHRPLGRNFNGLISLSPTGECVRRNKPFTATLAITMILWVVCLLCFFFFVFRWFVLLVVRS